MSDPKVEIWDVNRPIPYEKNAKIHSDKQVDTLAGLIKRYGFTQPIVVDADGVIIAGHGRRLAAKKLGLKKVPVIVRSDLTKEEADALRLADNQAASTEYDTELVQEELARLNDLDVDLSLLGYDEKELEFLTADLEEFDEGAFVDDIAEGVAEQQEENERKTKEIDDEQVSVVKVLGTSKVSRDLARKLQGFIDVAEAETEKEGAEALVAWLEAKDAAAA